MICVMRKRIISFAAALVMIISLMPSGTAVLAADSVIERLIATVDAGTVLLSWKNPSSGIIESIQVFDENGGEVVLASEPSKKNGEITSAKVEGLPTGKNYTYTLAINMQGGSSYKQDVSFKTGVNYQWDSQNGIKLTDLTGITIENANGVVPFRLDITKEAAHSGESGLHAVSNYNGWLNINCNWITLDSAKKYRAKAWVKLEGTNDVLYLCNDNTPTVPIRNCDWTEYSYDVSGRTFLILKLQIPAGRTFTNLYADDFGIYELDADGNEIGDNLIKNGGFEHTVYDYNLTDGVLSWKEPQNATYTGVDIYYRDVDGNETKLNETKIQKGTTEFTVPETYLTEESHDLIFVSYINDSETPARAFSILGNADYYKTVITKGGSEISSLEPGEVTVTRTMRNNKLGNDFSATLMLGLYKDGELLSIRYKGSNIPQNGRKTSISDTVTIPDDGAKYEVRAFLWDSPTGMNILKDADVFKMN